MIRHLSSKKFSIRIFSSELKFDHSKYFEKSTVNHLKDEFNIERYVNFNINLIVFGECQGEILYLYDS